MFGIVANMLLFSMAPLSLAGAISFAAKKGGALHIRVYTLLLGAAAALICAGYSIMSLTPYIEWAFLPRLFGLIGVDAFFLLELGFILTDMKFKSAPRWIVLGFFCAFALCDLSFHGAPNSLKYDKSGFLTFYETGKIGSHVFHYCYNFSMILALAISSFFWYKQKTIKREKRFALNIIFAHAVLVVLSIPDMAGGASVTKAACGLFCFGFACVFFIWCAACKRQRKYILSAGNVSKEVFYMLEHPVVIFDFDGKVNLCNPAAKWKFKIEGQNQVCLRDLFSFTDVETMRLLARSKKFLNGTYETSIKSTGEKCSLTCFVKIDYTGEPFCIIGTVTLSEVKGERL